MMDMMNKSRGSVISLNNAKQQQKRRSASGSSNEQKQRQQQQQMARRKTGVDVPGKTKNFSPSNRKSIAGGDGSSTGVTPQERDISPSSRPQRNSRAVVLAGSGTGSGRNRALSDRPFLYEEDDNNDDEYYDEDAEESGVNAENSPKQVRGIGIFDQNEEVMPFESEPLSIDPFERIKSLYKGHEDSVRSIAIDPPTNRMYSASWDDTVLAWDLSTFKSVGRLQHASWVNTVKIVHLQQQLPNRRFYTRTYIVTGSEDGELTLWSTQNYSGSSTSGGHNIGNNMVTNNNANSGYYSAGSNMITERYVTANQIRPGHGAITTMCILEDMIFAVSLSIVYIVNISSFSIVRELREPHNLGICCVAAHQEMLFTGGDEGKLLCWDVPGVFVLRELTGHTNTVRDIIISDHNSVYTCADDCKIRIWTLSTGTCLRTLAVHTKPVRCLAIHQGERERFLYSGSLDGSIRCTRLLNGKSTIVRSFTPHCLVIVSTANMEEARKERGACIAANTSGGGGTTRNNNPQHHHATTSPKGKQQRRRGSQRSNNSSQQPQQHSSVVGGGPRASINSSISHDSAHSNCFGEDDDEDDEDMLLDAEAFAELQKQRAERNRQGEEEEVEGPLHTQLRHLMFAGDYSGMIERFTLLASERWVMSKPS